MCNDVKLLTIIATDHTLCVHVYVWCTCSMCSNVVFACMHRWVRGCKHVGVHTYLWVVPSWIVVVRERYPVSLALLRSKIHHHHLINISARQRVPTGTIVWYEHAYKHTKWTSVSNLCNTVLCWLQWICSRIREGSPMVGTPINWVHKPWSN